MKADESILGLRHQVIYEVAKLAFEGQLEKAEYLPEKIIPGTLPHYRCCVYKEREIVRRRVRLSLGKTESEVDTGNIMQVIEPACADCPISSYSVTDNCRSCLGKACLRSCKFGAIQAGPHRSVIDATKCKECGQCAKACPYNAIVHLERPCKKSCPVDAISYDEQGLSRLDEEKCIRCGRCMHHCPFGAIGTIDSIVPVIEALKSGKEVYAMAAPAIEGQYGPEIGMGSWRKALKEVGFTDFFEVGLGGDLTTSAEAEEWYEAYQKGEMRTTSCCPAFVNMIRMHYPKLDQYVSTAVSPMCELSRMIKAQHPGAVTVFIGPCIAKKSEIKDQKIPGNADYALLYEEIEAILKAKEVELTPVEDNYQLASIFGKKYATSGGVAAAVLQYLDETGRGGNYKVDRPSGGTELRKTLTMASFGRLNADFVEGMACEGGCFNGPASKVSGPVAMKNRKALLEKADDRKITENLKNYDLDSFPRYR